jgi:DNA replication licensing factor MCM5
MFSPAVTDGKKCPMDPYVINHEKSRDVDQQTLKLQEVPEDVPVGELPRHLLLTLDRHLVNKVVPGSHLTLLGVYDVFQRNTSVC